MPTPSVVFANPAGTLLAHPAGYAEVRYQPGPPSIPDLEALLMQLGQLLLARSWHRALVDARQLRALPEATKAWARAHWTNPVIARPTGMVLATLLPTDVFGRLAVSELQLGAAADTNNRNFADSEAAHTYLSQLLPPA